MASGQLRLRGEEVEVVECGDYFAADQDFLEITTIPESTVVQNALPERGGDVGRSWVDRRQSRIDHANRLSTGHASASAASRKAHAGAAGWPTGLEPATARITIWSSTIELWPPTQQGF